MKKTITILFCLLMLLSTTSCLTLLTSDDEPSGSDISSSNPYGNSRYLYLKIFQTINKNEALAYTRKGDVVKIETDEDIYYDGNIISGKFAYVDTYTYETVSKAGDTEYFQQKTVPIFMKTSEYKKKYSTKKTKESRSKKAYDWYE